MFGQPSCYLLHYNLVRRLGAGSFNIIVLPSTDSRPWIVSSGNAWERRSQSYFDSGNGVPRNTIKPGQTTLGELYKKHHLHQNSPIKDPKSRNFSGEGQNPSPPPHLDPCAFGIRIQRSQSDFFRKRSLQQTWIDG